MLDRRLQADFSNSSSCAHRPCGASWDAKAADECLIGLVQAVVAEMLTVTLDDMRAPSRGKARVAFARQLAMYLCHVTLSFDQGRLAGAFGRDRTTVSHGVRRIEDRREDPVLDQVLETLEAVFKNRRDAWVPLDCSCAQE
ncbi:MAG: helix-turn-helix domain-containing protein [Alphaproteobacteria bacterium]